jgi:hypothetical protein
MKRRVKRHTVVQPQDPSYKIIPLTQGKNVLVDSADYEWLSQWNWSANYCKHTRSFYAQRWDVKAESTVRMHRELLCCGPTEQCDHRNRDTLDNRRQNLRKCTTSQNQMNHSKHSNNTSGFKGVSWHKVNKKWQALIGLNWKIINLGFFETAEEAAIAYRRAALIYHAEFART